MQILPNDISHTFPHLFVIPASAGSGKTYTLSHRYVQFLLSQKFPVTGLRSILAITFTKLAAKEMKERIVSVLKEAALKNEKTLDELSSLVSLSRDDIALRSEQMVNEILQQYSDFNVRTIDSFLTTVFKASSMELGIQPDVEIEFDHAAVVDEAFRQYSRQLNEGTPEEKLLDELILLIEINDQGKGGYLWNPYVKIVREVRELQKIFGRFSASPRSIDSEKELQKIQQSIIKKAGKLEKILEKTTLPVNHHFKNEISRLANGEVFAIAVKGKTKKYFNKYSDDAGVKKELQKMFAVIRPLEDELELFLSLYAHSFYQPFVRAVSMIEGTMHGVKLMEGKVIMDDVNRSLARYLSDATVPEVYIKLGERIAHFMIDEFQDTSPIQWHNLTPLIEEALSKRGSLFAVGDTKQSIYGFRGADWRIFRNLVEGKYFPSAPPVALPLTTNYRSAQNLVDFVKDVFSVKVAAAGLEEYAAASGLYNFAQDVPDKEKKKGYVEAKRFDAADESSAGMERDYILSVIRDCQARGYSFGDIAILTPANADVVEISSWLNKEKIPFLSLSTLDIRKRKIIGEVIALLRFLDSPIDDLSFATFVFGDLFRNVLKKESDVYHEGVFHRTFAEQKKGYLYRIFQKKFPELWERYFDRLFSLVGYMPLYDIVSEVLKSFSVFSYSITEESALIKLLECVKQYEKSGRNSLKDFLSFTTEDGDELWSIQIPATVHAVRIMTVHKAKGLGFPVVIVSLKEKWSRPGSMVTIETDEGLSLVRVGKNFGERVESLGKMYAEREREQVIDELNKVYVALTRARKEMYVSIMFKKVTNLPASIIPEVSYGTKYGRAEKEKDAEKLPLINQLYHTVSASLPVTSFEKIGLAETRRGDTIHAVLANIEYISNDLKSDISSAFDQTDIRGAVNAAHEQEVLHQFLSLDEVKIYFEKKAKRVVLREQDVAASNGRLYRIDRMVVEDEAVAIIDFKTGSDEKNEDHMVQVRNYMMMVREIYPEKIMTGALLYIDQRKVVVVK